MLPLRKSGVSGELRYFAVSRLVRQNASAKGDDFADIVADREHEAVREIDRRFRSPAALHRAA